MALRTTAFLETIIAFLPPYFTEAAANIQDARTEIIDTLASYPTRTRAEMLQAAAIIALSMTTLAVLAEAKTAEMSQSMRIRHRACANGLARATTQTEKALDRSLARDLPTTSDPDPRPAATSPDTQPAQLSRNRQLWAGAMIDTLRQMQIPLPHGQAGPAQPPA